MVQAFQYGSGNARLIDYDALGTGLNKFYMNVGGRTMIEYTEYAQSIPTWIKSNIYLGERQFSTITPVGTTGEYTEYNHPDKLGTRLITNQAGGTAYEQASLPFGTALNAESTITTNKKRFTSYERSTATGLDYAQNRTYDSKQGRFTQVDPIGMTATSLSNPQSLNLYSYVGNDPVNRTDPTGLFWGWLRRLFRAIVRIILVIAIVVVLVVLASYLPGLVGLIPNILGALGFGLAVIAGLKAISLLIGGLREILHPCNVPEYSGLSQRRQDELAQRGVTPDQWNALRNKQRLGYFNIVAAIAAAGLSLLGWVVDWAAGGIQQDRTRFKQGAGATNLRAQVRASSIFEPDRRMGKDHPGYEDSFRLKSLTRSTQLSFSPDGMRLEADIDIFNPNMKGIGSVFHFLGEVLTHWLGGKTNPYNVAYRSSWECR